MTARTRKAFRTERTCARAASELVNSPHLTKWKFRQTNHKEGSLDGQMRDSGVGNGKWAVTRRAGIFIRRQVDQMYINTYLMVFCIVLHVALPSKKRVFIFRQKAVSCCFFPYLIPALVPNKSQTTNTANE